MKKSVTGIFFLLGIFFLTPSFGQDLNITSRIISINKTKVSEVLYGHKVLFRFLGSEDTLSAEKRAEEAVSQVLQMAALGLDTKRIKLVYLNHRLLATVDNVLLFAITPKEAATQASGFALAEKWITRLQKVFDDIPGYAATDYTYVNPLSNEVSKYAWVKRSAELSDQNDPYVVAHKEFPFGTLLRLVNPDTQWTVVAKVGPRYPMPDDVSMLLSPLTALAIGMPETQIGRVAVEVVPN